MSIKMNFLQLSVQITVSNFHQWNHIAGYIFAIVIALFIGSWSDKRGRKIPLLIGLTGKLIYVLGILLNIYFGKKKQSTHLVSFKINLQ